MASHAGSKASRLASAAKPARAAASEAEPPERVVSSIQIEGAVNTKASDISARLKTRIGTILTREGLREDLKSIWDMGTFDDVTVDVTDVEGGSRVTFVVREQPLLREVRSVGVRELADKDLKEKITIKEGEFYDPVKVKATTEKILEAYRERGYPDATVKADLVPAEKERGKMDLVIAVTEGTKMHVGKITFAGNKAFPDSALKKVLKNKEAAFFFQSGLFLKDEVEKDKGRLLEFYKNEGYQKARIVSAEISPGPKPDRVELRFTLSEGVPYTVRSVTFDGNTMLSEAEARDKLALEAGAKLSQKALDEGLGAIRSFYTDKGYIYAAVIPDFTFDDAKGQADVVVRFHEGAQARIDRVLIRGNEETKDKIIVRELVIREGEVFDTAKIRRSQENVYNLGFFEDVRIYTEPSFKTGFENLIFEVKERQTGTISLGGGYSSQFGFVGFLQLTKANLFGLGIRVSAEWEIGQKRKNLQLDYFDPWFLDTRASVDLGFWDTDRDLPATFKQRSTGGSVTFGYRFPNRLWRVALGYKFEVDQVRPLPGQSNEDVRVLAGLPRDSSSPPAQTTSSPNLTLTYDNRDNIFDPLRGQAHQLFLQVAGGPFPKVNFLGGDTKFYKVSYDASVFTRAPVKVVPFFEPPSLAVHTRVARGWGFGGKDMPIFERFFLGGTDSVRGYNERELGPTTKDASGVYRPSGGRVMAQTNVELKWPLVPRVLTLAAPFYDVGYAWSSFPLTGQALRELIESPASAQRSLATSVGLGVRLTIPGTIMVIRLDYGWGQTRGYNPPKNGKLHFNIGNIF